MSSNEVISQLQRDIEEKDSQNKEINAQLEEMQLRFKDLKVKAERRAKLLHHVMAEYNAMTKEYNIMKMELTSVQSKNSQMYEHMANQELRIENLQQNVQVLEAENNDLRQNRIIDASSKQWYGECTHSCVHHPRSFPHYAPNQRTGVEGKTGVQESTGASCDTCSEAEAWAEGLILSPSVYGDSLRKHMNSTLPIRHLRPLSHMAPTSSQYSTPGSTLRTEDLKKAIAEDIRDSSRMNAMVG